MDSPQFPSSDYKDKAVRSRADLSRHTPSVHRHKNKTCPTCKKVFTSRHFKSHLKTHLWESERQRFNCSVGQCSKEYLNKSTLKMHIDRDHSLTTREKFKCHQCSKEYSDSGSLKSHVRKIHSGSAIRYSCNFCDATFSNKPNRDNHIVAAHTGEKAFQCKECPAKFSYSGGLYTHQFVHTANRPNKCKICSKSFKRPGNLTQHVNNIHSQRTRDFPCSICLKTFSRKANLNEHSRTHENTIGEYSCYFCTKRFLRKAHRGRHLSVHTQEKPFICSEPLCKYSSSDATELKTHIKRRHTPNSDQATSSRIWTCYFCSKTLTQAGHLEVHLRNHTQEEPFTCVLCQRSFTSRETLQRHIFSHTKEKSFSCPHCQKCFPQNNRLENHMAAVHLGVKRFFCEFCSYSSFLSGSMKKHKLCRCHLSNE